MQADWGVTGASDGAIQPLRASGAVGPDARSAKPSSSSHRASPEVRVGCQPSSRRARVVSMTGTLDGQVDPAGRRGLEVGPPRQVGGDPQDLRRHGHRPGAEDAAQLVGVEDGVGGDVERARGRRP